MNSVDFDDFAVERQKIKDWWKNHFRLHFKVHDPLGFFGAERFDYFCYGNKQDIELNGVSKAFVLLHTEKSLTRLPGNRYREIKERMADFGIDTEEVINGNELIFAYDKLSRLMIGRSSFSVFFPPFVKQPVQEPARNLQDPAQVKDLQDPKQVKDLQDPKQVKDLQDPKQVKDLQDPKQVKDLQDPTQVKDLQDPTQAKDLQDPKQDLNKI